MTINVRVAIFTGSRADYGLLRHLVNKIQFTSGLSLQLIVSGSHLSDKYGRTVDEIALDMIPISAKIKLSLDTSCPKHMAYLTAEAMSGVSTSLLSLEPDIFIVLGDRYEAFAAASAAHLHGVPILHIHGGERTLGAVDDKLRHSITQLSTWHFTSAACHRSHVISMGHLPHNVFDVGPMAIDEILNIGMPTQQTFAEKTSFVFGQQNYLVTYHSETLSNDLGIHGFRELLSVLAGEEANILFTHPNADEGGNQLIKLISEFASSDPSKYFVIPSLGHKLYLESLCVFNALLGNSSSGVIEAPLIGIPVMNIGNRQMGRFRHGYVIDAPPDRNSIFHNLNVMKRLPGFHRIPRRPSQSHPSPADTICQWLATSFRSTLKYNL